MAIQYHKAPDIQNRMKDLAEELGLDHIDERVVCVRSAGTKSQWTLARCHAMSKVFAAGLDIDMHYVIEVVAETFDVLDEEEQDKTIIHEMLHIPKAFGGGLKSHRYVTNKRVNGLYRELKKSGASAARTLRKGKRDDG
jgi:predicted metallopeptidase